MDDAADAPGITNGAPRFTLTRSGNWHVLKTEIDGPGMFLRGA
jgi:hypothetical protein